MKRDTKNFISFEQVVDPAIKTAFIQDKPPELLLAYRSMNDNGKEFMMKFRIVYPKNKEEVVEITHGYLFSIREDFILVENLQKLAVFFTFLMAESLNKVNQSLPKEKVKIPSSRTLVKVIHTMLIAKLN